MNWVKAGICMVGCTKMMPAASMTMVPILRYVDR